MSSVFGPHGSNYVKSQLVYDLSISGTIISISNISIQFYRTNSGYTTSGSTTGTLYVNDNAIQSVTKSLSTSNYIVTDNSTIPFNDITLTVPDASQFYTITLGYKTTCAATSNLTIDKQTTDSLLVYTPPQEEPVPEGKIKVEIWTEKNNQLDDEIWDWAYGQRLPLVCLAGYPIISYSECSKKPGEEADDNFTPISCMVLSTAQGDPGIATFRSNGYKIVYGQGHRKDITISLAAYRYSNNQALPSVENNGLYAVYADGTSVRGDITPTFPTWINGGGVYTLSPIRFELTADEAKYTFLGLQLGNSYIPANKVQIDNVWYIETTVLPTDSASYYTIQLSSKIEMKKIITDGLSNFSEFAICDNQKNPCLVFSSKT